VTRMQNLRRMRVTGEMRRMRVTGAVLLAAGVLLLSGCFSLGGAISGAIGKQIAPQPAPAAETAPAASAQDSGQNQQQARSNAGSAMAYQYQFGAFYGGIWNMGWYGYSDASFKPGQGTVLEIAGEGKKSSSGDKMTIERALLKVNKDASQWWRFKIVSGKDTILYEFLVGADSVVQKVRYKDPDSGTIGEFIPGKDSSQPAAGPSTAPRSRAELAKYKVDRQDVKVQAGSFTADHYLYTDDAQKGSSEFWVSEKVPGGMLKSVYTNKKDNKTSTIELVQIESGVTTALASY
jgi:hypothetical protein